MSSLASLEASLLADDLMCVVDEYTREITVPDGYSIAGVASDDATHTIKIKVPRIVDGSCDLSTFNAYVNYMNGNGTVAASSFNASTMEVNTDHLILKWSLSRLAMAYKGTLRFTVCFRCLDSSNKISKEWNSTIAEIKILDGLEATEVDPDHLKEELEELLLNANSLRAEVLNRIAGKVDTEIGKGLSSNDYTDADATRVAQLTDEYIARMATSEAGTNLKTLTASNEGYAAVYEWHDDNTNKEDRIGYFVRLQSSGRIIKANSGSYIFGVTVQAPGIAASAPLSKYNVSGKLLSKYEYVCMIGVVPVIDNGKCASDTYYCMPDTDGTAKPSSNLYGYYVLGRVDDTRILIRMMPQEDMLNRMYTNIATLEDKITQLTTICNGMDKRKELWSGSLYTIGETVNLSDAITNYDQIEFNFYFSGRRNVAIFDVSDCVTSTVQITQPNIADSATSLTINIAEMQLKFNTDTCTLNTSKLWQWTGNVSTAPTKVDTTQSSMRINSITGIKHNYIS